MIRPFAECDFVVTFTGECPESKLVHGWEAVLDYINSQINDETNGDRDPDTYYDVRQPECDLHNVDNWGTLGCCYANNDDERHTFESGEFVYCVGLQITRITEYDHVTPTVALPTVEAP